jgi:dihydroorotase
VWGLYPRKGVIAPGAEADIAVVDLKREMTLDDATMQTTAKVTPWHGRKVMGLPVHTLVRGRFVMRNRALVEGTQGHGRSVHVIQQMPPAQPRNTDQTMSAVTRVPARQTGNAA